MEDGVVKCADLTIEVNLLTGLDAGGVRRYGIRLHPYGKKLPKDLMILAAGGTFAHAMKAAMEKAEHGQWEHLNWAARPWEIGESAYSRATAAWGLA